MRENTQKRIRILSVLLIIAAIAVPVLFTAVGMGAFTSEPVIETEIQAGADAPELVIATDYDFCPNSYYNAKGELSGLYIELMIEAANRMGMRPVFETKDWIGCREMLTDGEADVLLGLEIFSNMEGTLRTIPVCSDELRVYGKQAIDSAAALAGKKVALMARSVIETTYDLQCEYVEYGTNTEILEAVENGDVDYGICHGAVATKIIEKNGFDLKSNLVISKSYPALAVKEDHLELRNSLNNVLQEMSLDGTIGRLQKKWITDFTKERSLGRVLQENQVFYLTYIFGVVILLCLVWGFRINDIRQKKYIRTLLDYQEKLQKSSEEVQKANQAKSEFLSHMSHDIRTPLNGILGMIEIIKKNKADTEKLDDCLDKIDMASNHLLSLITDVLNMSKIGSEDVQLEEVPITLEDEVRKIHAIVDVQARNENIQFSIDMKNIQRSHLIGSPTHVRRILLNLINNALRYNKENGSVNVVISETDIDNEKVNLEMVVSDTGIGMSREFIEHSLYEPFVQEHAQVRTEYKGTGLGMSIVKELVEKMGGTISVESEVGKGTTFTVVLPMKIDPVNSESKAEETEEKPIAGIRVLAAEDNLLNLEVLEFMLEDAGAEVTAVLNGQQAVENYEAVPAGTFDAILMDIMMPVMDGLEAAKAIRRLNKEDAMTIPIIAMTANAFAEDREKTIAAGMNEHLTKPIDRNRLIQCLNVYCQKKKS